MLPYESSSTPLSVPEVTDQFRLRSSSDSRKVRVFATGRPRSPNDLTVSGNRRDDLDTRKFIPFPSKGEISNLPQLRMKPTIPTIVVSSDTPAASGRSTPETETISGSRSSGFHRQRSNSTAERPHIFLTDPAINRPQVAPSTVESIRAKIFRQKKDLAPRWSKILTTQDPGTYDQKDGEGLSSPDSPSMKSGKFEIFQNSVPETNAYNTRQRRASLLPFITNRNPEFSASSEVRQRSASRGLADFFRFRKKSVSADPETVSQNDPNNDDRTSSPLTVTKKGFLPLTLRRQRSKSTADAPRQLDLVSHLEDQSKASSEPIAVKVFNPKRRDSKDRGSMLSFPGQLLGLDDQQQQQHTPMSDLLSMGSDRVDSRSSFGILDFLELYKNHTESKSGEKSPGRRLSDIQKPQDLGFNEDSVDQMSSLTLNPTQRNKTLQSDLPESIPEYLEVHQVRSTDMRQRRRHVSPGLTTGLSSEAIGGLDAAMARSRRFSEPPIPNLQQLSVLNSIRMKLVSNTSPITDDNDNIVKNISLMPNVARSLGIKIPMTSRHKLLLWKDKDKEAQLLKLPVNCDESFNLGANDRLTFVKLMKQHKCHELMPHSAALVLLDSELEVISAFYALMFNGVKSAPIWDSSKKDFVGMLTVTEFINILRMFYKSPEIGNLEEHRLSNWMHLLHGSEQTMISVDPDDSLFEAAMKLSTHRIHRVLVADSINGDALYILNYKKILQFIYLLMFEVELPSYMNQSIEELNIGTYEEDVCSVQLKTPLIDALRLLVERRISALPVVDEGGRVVNIYAKVDAISLAINQSYKNLDCSVEEALEIQRERFEGVFLCKRTETLNQVTRWIVQENVHRLIIVDDQLALVGVVSLSDIVRFLVIKQFEESTDFDIQPGDIHAEMDMTL